MVNSTEKGGGQEVQVDCFVAVAVADEGGWCHRKVTLSLDMLGAAEKRHSKNLRKQLDKADNSRWQLNSYGQVISVRSHPSYTPRTMR